MGMILMLRTILIDDIWNKLEPLLPAEKEYWVGPARSHRELTEAILESYVQEQLGKICLKSTALGVVHTIASIVGAHREFGLVVRIS